MHLFHDYEAGIVRQEVIYSYGHYVRRYQHLICKTCGKVKEHELSRLQILQPSAVAQFKPDAIAIAKEAGSVAAAELDRLMPKKKPTV